MNRKYGWRALRSAWAEKYPNERPMDMVLDVIDKVLYKGTDLTKIAKALNVSRPVVTNLMEELVGGNFREMCKFRSIEYVVANPKVVVSGKYFLAPMRRIDGCPLWGIWQQDRYHKPLNKMYLEALMLFKLEFPDAVILGNQLMLMRENAEKNRIRVAEYIKNGARVE